MPRQRLCVMLLLVLAAAVINLAIALWLAWRTPSNWMLSITPGNGWRIGNPPKAEMLPTPDDHAEWYVAQHIAFGARETLTVSAVANDRLFIMATPYADRSNPSPLFAQRHANAPGWTYAHRASTQASLESPYVFVGDSARGWPLLCFRMETHLALTTPIKPSSIYGAITLGGNRHLPIRPIWPGFAINTVFYAVILWGLFAAPFVLRKKRRIKRGLCPKCAYDLRGHTDAGACPECGQALTLRNRHEPRAEQGANDVHVPSAGAIDSPHAPSIDPACGVRAGDDGRCRLMPPQTR